MAEEAEGNSGGWWTGEPCMAAARLALRGAHRQAPRRALGLELAETTQGLEPVETAAGMTARSRSLQCFVRRWGDPKGHLKEG